MVSGRFWLDSGSFGWVRVGSVGFGWVRMISGGFMFYQLPYIEWKVVTKHITE